MTKLCQALFAYSLILLVALPMARASETDWYGYIYATGWEDPTGWTNGVPNSSSDAYVDGPVTITTGPANAATLTLPLTSEGRVTQNGSDAMFGTVVLGAATPAMNSDNIGEYDLFGGTMHANSMVIGSGPGSVGTFIQRASTYSTITGDLTVGGGTSNSGSYQQQGGTLTIGGSFTLGAAPSVGGSNIGTYVGSPGSTLSVNADMVINHGGSNLVAPAHIGGDLIIAPSPTSSGKFDDDDNVFVAGNIRLGGPSGGSGTLLNARDSILTASTISAYAHTTITLAPGSVTNTNSLNLDGAGLTSGGATVLPNPGHSLTVNNAGYVQLPSDVLTLGGQYMQTSAGAIDVAITTNGTANVTAGLLSITGSAVLSGTLSVTGSDLLTPGLHLTILRADGGISGTFGNVQHSVNQSPIRVEYTSNSVIISLVPEPGTAALAMMAICCFAIAAQQRLLPIPGLLRKRA